MASEAAVAMYGSVAEACRSALWPPSSSCYVRERCSSVARASVAPEAAVATSGSVAGSLWPQKQQLQRPGALLEFCSPRSSRCNVWEPCWSVLWPQECLCALLERSVARNVDRARIGDAAGLGRWQDRAAAADAAAAALLLLLQGLASKQTPKRQWVSPRARPVLFPDL